ncbi:MAG: cell wall-binding repeat-containing protein, partial [Raoultibacter sp.]
MTFFVFASLLACCYLTFPTNALAEDFSGGDRYDTAAREARAAFPYGAETAIIVTGQDWSDALSITGLAGCLDAPILYTPSDQLSNYTMWAIHDLSISSLILVGNTDSISPQVEELLATLEGIESVERIAGADALDTQMAVFTYGLERNLWSNERIIVTSGELFPDALSASPVAFVGHSPIFLTFNGMLSEEQERALIDNSFNEILVLGGPSAVSDQTYGYLTAAALRNTGTTDTVIRLAGNNRWETSSLIAQWATSRGILSWNNAALTTAYKPYDALAGSALQGKRGAVLLLADSIYDPTVYKLIDNRHSVSQISFFGDHNTYSLSQRNYIRSYLGL